jgi:glycosyltransferase involved in cell wall biosynthesis
MNSTKISIIIPAYNAEKYIAKTIESVRSQNVEDWELVIVDDGSQDGTGAIAEQFAKLDPRIQVLRQENRGLSAARNSGFANTNRLTGYISFLDADDTMEPDALEILTQTLKNQPDAVGAHGLARAIDSDGMSIRINEIETRCRERWSVDGDRLIPWPLECPTTFACQVLDNYIQTAGVLLIRRGMLEAAGLFDENMSGCADWDMWIRLCHFGNIAFVNRVVLNYRLHGNNMSGRLEAMFKDEMYMRKKLLTDATIIAERRMLALFALRYRLGILRRVRQGWAADCIRSGRLVAAAKQLWQVVKLWRLGAFALRGISGYHRLQRSGQSRTS